MRLQYHARIGLCSLLVSVLWAESLFAEPSTYEWSLLKCISTFDSVSQETRSALDRCISRDYPVTSVSYEPEHNALFRAYPQLIQRLSYVHFGSFPTPVHRCTHMEAYFPANRIFLKNDGITGPLNQSGKRGFGGNKMRKLQYLIADALAHGHNAVMTFGCVGSNHATLTAACARAMGLECFCMLLPQIPAHVVRRNLLLQYAYGAHMLLAKNRYARAEDATTLCIRLMNKGNMPYVIPTGGSTPLGIIGYVEAAFELKEQIDAGIMPMPDHIYITCGTGGTTAGLLLGCKAAGITTKIHAVLDEPSNPQVVHAHLQQLINDAHDLLRSYDNSFPDCSVQPDDYEIITAAAGRCYGEFTVEGVEAMRFMHDTEGIILDGVYSGKCCSALLHDLRTNKLDNSVILFWDTFCAELLEHVIESCDYHQLPSEFHPWFENKVQPLDSVDQQN